MFSRILALLMALFTTHAAALDIVSVNTNTLELNRTNFSGSSVIFKNGVFSNNLYIGSNPVATISYVDGATQRLVTASITNGLATTTYVNNATQGLVTASITNGLATTNFVNTAVASAANAGTNYVNLVTQSLVTASVTNGLALSLIHISEPTRPY